MARTKGSKNGISRTKGYTAVGKKAKGRWVNGRYVYDTRLSQDNQDLLDSAHAYTNWKAAHGSIGDRRLLIRDASDKGSKNNWQQQANAQRAGTEAARKYYSKQSNQALYTGGKAYERAIDSVTQNENAKKKNYQDTLAKGAAMGDAAKAAYAQRKAEAKARWQAGNKAMAANKAKTQGAKNNWQQQAGRAELNEKWNRKLFTGDALKQINMSNRAAAKKAAYNGAKNNWQQKAAREAASVDTKNKALSGNSKAVYMPRKVGGGAYVNPSNFEIDTERKPNKTKGANAMRNDPRYDLYGSIKIKEAAATRAKKSLERNKKPVTSSKSNVSKIEKAITDASKKKKKKK